MGAFFSYFIVIFIALISLYFLYLPVLFLFSFSRKKRTCSNLFPSKSVSVIVATYNEERVIRQKLETLLSVDFPERSYEIIVVDSGSIDNTRAIVSEYINRGVILLEQEKRLGKASALNFALTKAKGDIIIISDANSEFSPTAINTIIKNFESDTGAVLPRFMPTGTLRLWDKVFYWLHHIYKKLESDADSVFIVFGELFAFRRDLINKIDEQTAADDLEIAINIRMKNFKVKYVPDVVVKEKLPVSRPEIKTQKVRHILGILQVMKKHINLLWNPKYGLYGMLIFPVHFMQMTIGPLLCFGVIGLFTMSVVSFAFIFLNTVFFIALFAIFTFFIVIYKQSTTVRNIVLFLFDFISLQIYVIMAILDLIKRKDAHIWEKICSTR